MTARFVENPPAATSFVVKLTTPKGTVYHYAPLAAASPDEAVARVLGTNETETKLRPLGETRWERTESDGTHVLVWADRRRLPTPAAPYRRLLWLHL